MLAADDLPFQIEGALVDAGQGIAETRHRERQQSAQLMRRREFIEEQAVGRRVAVHLRDGELDQSFPTGQRALPARRAVDRAVGQVLDHVRRPSPPAGSEPEPPRTTVTTPAIVAKGSSSSSNRRPLGKIICFVVRRPGDGTAAVSRAGRADGVTTGPDGGTHAVAHHVSDRTPATVVWRRIRRAGTLTSDILPEKRRMQEGYLFADCRRTAQCNGTIKPSIPASAAPCSRADNNCSDGSSTGCAPTSPCYLARRCPGIVCSR